MEKKSKFLKYFLLSLIALIIFVPAAKKYCDLWLENKKLEGQVRELEAFNSKLKTEKFKLQHDLDYVERVARQKMGIVKKGEIIYKIEK